MKADALDKLHDFYQPAPPSWVPHTIGWYVVFGVIALLIAWAAWRVFARWRRNRYRREAIRELEGIPIQEVPALLKRTALAAWPREEVASLSGARWLGFLEKHSGNLPEEAGHLLLALDYQANVPTSEEERRLRRAAGEWIRRHRVRT